MDLFLTLELNRKCLGDDAWPERLIQFSRERQKVRWYVDCPCKGIVRGEHYCV